MAYANFWKRVAASVVDGFIYGAAVGIIGQVVGLMAGVAMGVSGAGKDPSIQAVLLVAGLSFLVQVACYVLYYVWPECSPWQATIGKKIFGLKVTDEFGQRIGFWRSLGRNLGMIVSALILGIGYLMCIWTEKKQCLHDQMAGCLVVDQTPNEKKGCAIAVVIVLVVLWGALIAGIVAAIALPQYARAVERARAAEAISLVGEARRFQRLYQQENGNYATRWSQLANFTWCAHETSHLCKIDNFTLELEAQGIAAQREGGAYKYRIFRAYDPADTRRNLVCISHDENTKAFCRAVMDRSGSSR